jgi:malonyl-CoA/methylmalonyl-CoA synthetase
MTPLFPRLDSPDDGEALRIERATLTYAELAGSAAVLARRLEGAERVAVWATSTVHTCVGVVGAVAAGVTVVPLNPRAGARELEHVIADSAPAFVLTTPADELPPQLAAVPRLDVTLATAGPPLPDRLEPESTALILYTSGTTGPPKGARIPRRAIESNLDALAQLWEWSGDDRLAHALPLFHVHGLVLGVLGPLRRGGELELVPHFSAAAVADAVRRGATMVFGVPTMYHRIGAEAETNAELARTFGRARLLVSGSAALPATEHERINRLTSKAIVERYGMTETLMNIGVGAHDEPRPGYVGRPVPGVDIRLLDDAGETLAGSDDETIGEIAVRGPNLFTGYLNRPDATEQAMRGDWFLTGDLATRAPDGSYRIVGRRATDLIKSGGFKIGAGEIEAALLEHPAVAEVAVAGVPDDDLGERIGAWVVLAPGANPKPDDLVAHVGSLLSSYKRPRDIWFVDELPRNALGKVLKKELVPGR